MLHRMIRQIKVSSDRLRCVFVMFLYVAKMFSESVAQSSTCFTDIQLFAKSAGYTVDDIG